MTRIKNVRPVGAEALFQILKSDFVNEVNLKLHSSLTIEYAHVYNVINVYFLEIIVGTVFTITVYESEIELSHNGDNNEYITVLLQKQLYDFLLENAVSEHRALL